MATRAAILNMLSSGLHQGGRMTWELSKAASLLFADAVIALSLRRVGRPRPGVRRSWPVGLWEALYNQQGGLCIYCRARLDEKPSDIDHMVPVNWGGTNERDNLQLLCRRCNIRKLDRTDWQFRFKYSKLLPQEPRRLPQRPITQERFERETRVTKDHESYLNFKRGRYLTPAQKINSGVLVAGGTVATLVFLVLQVSIKPNDLLWPVLVGLFLGAAVGGGIWLRARHTGRDREVD